MYKIFVALLEMFWIFDIFNLPFMADFDTTYPINGWVWLCIWLLLPSATTVIKKIED